MTDTKPWYRSRTVWASLVTMLAALCGLLGLPADGLADPSLVDSILQAVAAVAGLVALIGRIVAKSRIGG